MSRRIICPTWCARRCLACFARFLLLAGCCQYQTSNIKHGTCSVAEGGRFELTTPFGLPVFKTGAINRSATPPDQARIRDSQIHYSISSLLQVKSRSPSLTDCPSDGVLK